MGQKVNPIGLRLGINKTWLSRWYVDPREYAATLHEDLKLRKVIMALPETKGADIAEIEIVRHPQRVTIVIHTGRPGVIIGVKGANIEKIGNILQKVATKKVQIKIKEIKKVDTNAQLVAMNIARQLENRGSFRKCMKQAISNAMKGGSQGCKVHLSGRLGGAEMSRSEQQKDGRIPLHTLRADIDYGFAEAFTTYGKIGVKVWMFQGMLYKTETNDDAGQLVKRPKREQGDRPERAERPHRAERGQKSERGPKPERGQARS